MKSQIINIGLLTTNLTILFFITTSQKASKNNEGIQPIIKANIIELVDNKGTVRAQLKVEEDGEAILRMKASNGDIRLKMGAGTEGSGLVLLDNTTEVGIQALAKGKGSFITIANQNGKKQTIKP